MAFHPREGGNNAVLDAVGPTTARVRVHELAVRPEEGGGLDLSTGHACQQRPRPSALDRAGEDSPLAFRRKVGCLSARHASQQRPWPSTLERVGTTPRSMRWG